MMNQDAAAAEAGRQSGPPHPCGTGTLNVEDPHAHLVPVPATIRQPVTIGADPAGKPLQVALWNPLSGGMTIAVTGDGTAAASVVNSIAERVTACDDAALLLITRQAPDGSGWASLAEAAGHAAGDGGGALLVLQLASLMVHGRRDAGRDGPVHVPSNDAPLRVLLIEDAPALAGDPEALALLAQVCKTARPEGVTVIITGEPAAPGAEVRASVDADLTIDAAQLAGQAFAWQDGGAARLAARRAVWRMPRPLEPALASLQPLLDLAACPAGEAPGPWPGERDLPGTSRDGKDATPRTSSAPGAWYATAAEHEAGEVERILDGKCDGPGGRMTGHGLIAVTYALLGLREVLTASTDDVAAEVAEASVALAEITTAIEGVAGDGRRPRLRRPPRRRPAPGIEYTDPGVFTRGVAEGWADPQADPAEVDWTARLATALIPYATCHGRPVSPWAPTGIRAGRNRLGRWGENAMADALVTCWHRGERWLLLVERGDGGGWAVPGGKIEAGEDGLLAAVRELEEETGLSVPLDLARAGLPRHVPDPRASDEAWAVTVPCEVDLGGVGELPAVKGADDARRAAWMPARDYDDLLDSLIIRYGRTGTATVFSAHQQMLRAWLGGLPAARHDNGPPVVIHTVGWLWRWVERLGSRPPGRCAASRSSPRPASRSPAPARRSAPPARPGSPPGGRHDHGERPVPQAPDPAGRTAAAGTGQRAGGPRGRHPRRHHPGAGPGQPAAGAAAGVRAGQGRQGQGRHQPRPPAPGQHPRGPRRPGGDGRVDPGARHPRVPPGGADARHARALAGHRRAPAPGRREGGRAEGGPDQRPAARRQRARGADAHRELPSQGPDVHGQGRGDGQAAQGSRLQRRQDREVDRLQGADDLHLPGTAGPGPQDPPDGPRRPADRHRRPGRRPPRPQAAPQAGRQGRGRPPVGADHFTGQHQLARAARALCDARQHTARRRIGRVACGQCWETVIRDDERTVKATIGGGQ